MAAAQVDQIMPGDGTAVSEDGAIASTSGAAMEVRFLDGVWHRGRLVERV